jgi:hypothetical protein
VVQGCPWHVFSVRSECPQKSGKVLVPLELTVRPLQEYIQLDDLSLTIQ